jgi:ABC-type sugar transport system ATPase subunit
MSSTTEADPQERHRVLWCEGLEKWFGGVQSLGGVSLALHAGEVIGLVGDNGAGKSTLIKTLSGFYSPDGGSIWLDGERLEHLDPSRARELGVETVYQDLALCDNLDAVANVVLGQEPVRRRLGPITLVNRPKAREMALERLSQVGVRLPNLKASVRRLSGGQRQAVAIARAMMHARHVMMFDEPTAALGVAQTEATLNVIRTVASRGIGVIVISHSIGDVFSVADRIVVLRLGRVVLDVPVSETTHEEVIAHITGATQEPAR